MSIKNKFPLFVIICLGLAVRLFALNWDAGFHLHPDERAIILYTLPLQFPLSLDQFFSPSSPWNPHFFAYGSFPLYLLKTIGGILAYNNPNFTGYDDLTLIGRVLSACFDTGTIIYLYLISNKVFKKNSIGVLAAGFYAICVLPIQLSHFYAVDTVLTFFTTVLLYKLLCFYETPTKQQAIGIGILLGFSLATKISAIVLVISILTTLSIDFIFIFLHQPHKINHWFPHIPKVVRQLSTYGLLLFVFALATFYLLEPYAFIDFPSFYDQSLQQAAMTKSAFIFPYTLQYVGKVLYLYELKNIFFWGMGPFIATAAFAGGISFFIDIIRNNVHRQQKLIITSFLIVYFGIVGHFAIGFMRYMLPLYPILSIFAAVSVYTFSGYLLRTSKYLAISSIALFSLLITIWPVSFLSIYMYPPTRLSATEWIVKNIPPGKTIAIEHWDDALPLYEQQQYKLTTLELYNPDTTEKWQKISQQLRETDYIIIASNRLYTPLQKLTYCEKLPPMYCYKKTAQYYKDLFNGTLGFIEVKKFSVKPTIPFINIPINDQAADESFTVYDHPMVIIFKKSEK